MGQTTRSPVAGSFGWIAITSYTQTPSSQSPLRQHLFASQIEPVLPRQKLSIRSAPPQFGLPTGSAQSPLQHCPSVVHVAKSARQTGVAVAVGVFVAVFVAVAVFVGVLDVVGVLVGVFDGVSVGVAVLVGVSVGVV